MSVFRKQGRYHDDAAGRRRRRGLLAPAVVAAVALTAVGWGGSASGVTSPASTGPHQGGSLTVLEEISIAGEWPDGLDPATSDTLELNTSILDAIYGSLFEVGNNNTITPDLASGYSITDSGKVLTLDLRKGAKFSDGTAFDASAVIYNWNRDLKADQNGVPPWPKWTATSPNASTVVVHFATPDGAAVSEMLDSAFSWIASPAAVKKLGETRFKFFPVGAGPFEVVSDTTSAKIVLKKNPDYWQKGHPYLDNLTFESVSSDETALEDLRAKDAQVYEYMTTPALVSSFKSAGLKVVTDPAVAVLGVQPNATYRPFNNIKAREALYYAIDPAAFEKVLKGTCAPTESDGGPGGLFYEKTVPGYRTYDLAKAKALVKQLGGLSFTMYYQPIGLMQEEAIATRQMFVDAGMKVKLVSDVQIADEVAQYESHKWQAFFTTGGSFDPAGSDGLALGFSSTSPISGVHDAYLDKLINEGAELVGMKARAAVYATIAKYMSEKAYSPGICAPDSWDAMDKDVSGPGLTSHWGNFGNGPMTQWENVYINKG